MTQISDFLMQHSCLEKMHGLYYREEFGLGADAMEGYKAGQVRHTICTAVSGDSCRATAPTAAVTTATILTTSCTGTILLKCGADVYSMLLLAIQSVTRPLYIGVGAFGVRKKTPSHSDTSQLA